MDLKNQQTVPKNTYIEPKLPKLPVKDPFSKANYEAWSSNLLSSSSILNK